MKICLLTRSFDLKGGGIGRVSSEIKMGLERLGHEVFPISSKGEGLVSYFKYTALDLPFRIPKGMDIYHALTPMESIWIPKDKGVSIILDIIPITNPKRYGGRLGYTNSNGVVTFHDLFPIANPKEIGAGLGYNRLKSFLGCNYFRFACKQAVKCRYVVTVSEHVRQEVIKHLNIDGKRVRVIRSGIREDLDPIPKEDGVFRVGYLGQLDKRKRVDLLIRAFRRSTLDELVIGGVGLDEAMLRRQAEGDKRVRFLGHVPDGELATFYNSLNVFVFPTAVEGYGLPPVEAMACKKPTIVLSDAIIPDEVKNRCIIVQNLDMVLGNKTYLQGLCRYVDYYGNFRWAKEHSWDKCVKEYVKLYEEVLNG